MGAASSTTRSASAVAAAKATTTTGSAPLSLPVRREAAECLKALGHPVRLRMVELLLERELNVNELAEACRVTQPVASTHLRFLQRCRLFAAERRGKSVYYRVAEPGVADLLNLIRRRFSRRVSP
jgi:ArsR family transcriptional regulator, zinc-responsive transcriptional repressor